MSPITIFQAAEASWPEDEAEAVFALLLSGWDGDETEAAARGCRDMFSQREDGDDLIARFDRQLAMLIHGTPEA